MEIQFIFNSILKVFLYASKLYKLSNIFSNFFHPSGLIIDGTVQLDDNLVDPSTNRPIASTVSFEVKYSSPENTEGNFDSPTVSKFVHQASLEEDQKMLLDIERNIANLERSLNQGSIKFNLAVFFEVQRIRNLIFFLQKLKTRNLDFSRKHLI